MNELEELRAMGLAIRSQADAVVKLATKLIKAMEEPEPEKPKPKTLGRNS